MSARPVPFLLAAATVLVSGACGASGPDTGPEARPNVLVVVVDTLRADRLGLYGYGRETAPFLAEFAAGAVVFERAWSTSSWTAPATASLFTSTYPFQHGVTLGMGVVRRERESAGAEIELNAIPAELETLPTFFQERGYQTLAITDNPNICAAEGFERGFESFANADYAGAPWVNSQLLLASAELHADRRPWFVYLHYMDPHAPYEQRDPHFRAPAGGARGLERKSARYDSEIGYLDAHLREAFTLLGVDDDTVVVFTSDHGEEFGEHGRSGHPFQLHGELTRVPLILHHPGVEPLRRRVTADVSNFDVLPTLRAILGAPPSDLDQGRDLTRTYLSDEPAPPRTLFAMRTFRRGDEQRHKLSVLHDGMKLIRSEPEGTLELYDVVRDPGEQVDLAASDPETCRRLLELWERYQADAPTWDPVHTTLDVDQADLETLNALGYGGNSDD